MAEKNEERGDESTSLPLEMIEEGMEQENAQPEQSQQIALASVQNIQNVAELHEQLVHALNNTNQIDIDASAITTVDTATLQLLLVLKQSAIKMQKSVNIDFPSEKFIEAAELLGLAEMLDVNQSAAGFF